MSKTVKFAGGRTVTFKSSGRKKKGVRKGASRKMTAKQLKYFGPRSGAVVKSDSWASEVRDTKEKRERLIS